MTSSRRANSRAGVSSRRSSRWPANTSVPPASLTRRQRLSQSSTTAFSSTSRTIDALHDGRRIGQRGKHGPRMMRGQLIYRVAPRGHGNGARAKRAPARDVRWRVADHEHAAPRHFEPEVLRGAALRDGRQLRTVMMVRSERTHAKTGDVDARRTQLECGAGTQISREQAEHDVAARFERVEQRHHALEDMRVHARRQFHLEPREIEPDEWLHPRADRGVGVPRGAHEITHDLRISLAIVAIVRGSRTAEDVLERCSHGATAGAISPEKRAVNVEENELHERVRRTPAMMVTAPNPCQSVGTSAMSTHDASSAITGCTLE